MTVGLYCRVSTDEQAQHGFSIDNQKERLEAYCVSQGWTDYRLYVDDGYTGTNMDRPALKRLISHIKTGQINIVIVYKLDRLGRKQKDVLFLLEDVFDKYDVAFKSATEPFDTSTSLGKAMLGILAVFAQLERDTIVERTTSGRRSRIRKGLWYGGRVPFGYDWNSETQKLTINPQQADIVRSIYEKSLQGYAYNAIAEWASERTSDIMFDHSVIRDMLTRPIYSGRMNNVGDLVDGRHDAIIDEHTWRRVQQEVERRKDGAPTAGTYLLSGLLRCGVCQGPMIHITTKSRGYEYDYYVCKKQHVRPKGSTETCSLGFKRVETLENDVITTLKEYAQMTDQVMLERLQSNRTESYSDAMMRELETKLEDVTQQVQAFVNMVGQGVNMKEVTDKMLELQDEKRKIELRLAEMTDTIKTDITKNVIQSIRLIGEHWDILTFEERQTVLRTALGKIEVLREGRPKLHRR